MDTPNSENLFNIIVSGGHSSTYIDTLVRFPSPVINTDIFSSWYSWKGGRGVTPQDVVKFKIQPPHLNYLHNISSWVLQTDVTSYLILSTRFEPTVGVKKILTDFKNMCLADLGTVVYNSRFKSAGAVSNQSKQNKTLSYAWDGSEQSRADPYTTKISDIDTIVGESQWGYEGNTGDGLIDDKTNGYITRRSVKVSTWARFAPGVNVGGNIDNDKNYFSGKDGERTWKPFWSFKNFPFHAVEWDLIKSLRKKWKTILVELSSHIRSFPSLGVEREECRLICVEIIENIMHINNTSTIYMEYMDLFMGFLDNTGTLVNFDGIGHIPQVLVKKDEGKNATTALVYERMRDKFLNRWYAWAAQFWLPDKHAEWFRELRNMSHTPDTSFHLTTKLALLDDSSPGVYRFYRIACTGASMPLLEKLTFLKNLSAWWEAPKEQRWREDITWPAVASDKRVDIEIHTQDNRRVAFHEVLDYVKTENMTDVILYTTSIDMIAYCIYKDIDIIIENNWSGCISVKGIRNQIESQRSLLGSGTIWVKPETKILTFLALMMCSCSHGLTMYAAFGWDNVLAEWYKIVGYEPTVVKEEDADEKCVWLARMQDENILLNAPLFNILFVRLMNKAFTPDKKISKGDNGVGYMKYLSKYYTEMKDEDRIGGGRVKPVITEELVRSDGVADDGGTDESKDGEPRETGDQETEQTPEEKNVDEEFIKTVMSYIGTIEQYEYFIKITKDDVDMALDEEVLETKLLSWFGIKKLPSNLLFHIQKLSGKKKDLKISDLISVLETVRFSSRYLNSEWETKEWMFAQLEMTIVHVMV